MATENRIERTIGLVMLAVLGIGCLLVLRPFFAAVCFALILVAAPPPRWSELISIKDPARPQLDLALAEGLD